MVIFNNVQPAHTQQPYRSWFELASLIRQSGHLESLLRFTLRDLGVQYTVIVL